MKLKFSFEKKRIISFSVSMLFAALLVVIDQVTKMLAETYIDKNEPIDAIIRPEDVDVVAPEKGMLTGVVSSVTFKGVHYEIIVDINGFKWMIQTTDYVAPNETIGLFIEPDAIHIMKKSEYSDMFGDYSSFSEELDHLSDITEEDEV